MTEISLTGQLNLNKNLVIKLNSQKQNKTVRKFLLKFSWLTVINLTLRLKIINSLVDVRASYSDGFSHTDKSSKDGIVHYKF